MVPGYLDAETRLVPSLPPQAAMASDAMVVSKYAARWRRAVMKLVKVHSLVVEGPAKVWSGESDFMSQMWRKYKDRHHRHRMGPGSGGEPAGQYVSGLPTRVVVIVGGLQMCIAAVGAEHDAAARQRIHASRTCRHTEVAASVPIVATAIGDGVGLDAVEHESDRAARPTGVNVVSGASISGRPMRASSRCHADTEVARGCRLVRR